MDGSFNQINALPMYPTNNSCSCGAGLFVSQNTKIMSATKELTKCVTALTAIAGFNNYQELSDLDKQYLYDKISKLMDSLDDLKDIFQVKTNDEKE